MWKTTFEYLKDHLSYETIEKYGPKEEVITVKTAENVEIQNKNRKPAVETDNVEQEEGIEVEEETHRAF